MSGMRTVWLLPLLLLGCLQTAFSPPACHDILSPRLRITATPQETAPTPAERATAFQRHAETAQPHVLPGASKLFKAFLTPSSVLALEAAASAFRFDRADRARALSPLARPLVPRAPPTTPRL
jgi:hypothetical protein